MMNEEKEIRFIDLFSGIGGFRRGLELIGGYRCVWSCDNNKYANQVYVKQFGEENHYPGDIRGVSPGDIPDFDLLCAGFPCQSFSVAGKGEGFQDTRGTLFFEISRIAESKRPQMLLLENVKGLLSNDRGKTFHTILQELGRLGYWAEWQVLNSKYWVPQNRERVFIIGHLRNGSTRPIFPIAEIGRIPARTQEETQGKRPRLRNEHNRIRPITGRHFQKTAYEPEGISPTIREGYGDVVRILKRHRKDEIRDHGQLVPTLTESHQHYGGANLPLVSRSLRVGGSGIEENLVAQTISHRYYKDGSENLVSVQPVLTPDRLEKRQHGRRFKEDGEPAFTLTGQDIHGVMIANTVDQDGYLRRGSRNRDEFGKSITTSIGERRIRRLTPCECERLQGFPDRWTEWGIDENREKVKISDTQRYKMLGNAVTTKVITFLGHRIMEVWE
ncbi:MAG: DNA (cytosine-5-)-methyltransferase [Candidatus Thorarchaeota archaeon]